MRDAPDQTCRSTSVGITVLFATILFTPTILAGQVAMTEHDVGFGISLSLPASWSADTQVELSMLREQSVDLMSGSALQSLREFARSNSNALLFRAIDSDDSRNSVTLNVTVGPESNAHSIDALTPDELTAVAKQLCDEFADQAAEAGGEGRCTEHEVRTLQGRGALILRQTAKIPALELDNRRVVAMIPAEGVLLTLTLSVGVDDYDPALVSALLASIKMPSG